MGVGVNGNLIPPVPGERRNPNGRPKGSLNLSTHIQNMLNDPDFKATVVDREGNAKEYKGAPVTAIIRTAILKAMGGDKQWAEWLAKHGFGTKQIHEFEGDAVDAILAQYKLTNTDIQNDIEKEREESVRENTEAESGSS